MRFFFFSKKYLKVFIVFIITSAVFAFIFVVSAISLATPQFSGLENRKIVESTKIYDRTGNIILYDVHGEIKRTYIPFDEIPRNLKNATIAVEDSGFYQHGGISFFSIGRAFFINLIHGKIKQGGSTITQQLVKNALLTSEKKFIRKFKEAILSFKIEKQYSKDEILNFYLNEIPYGSNNYGVESAAQGFFGKNAKDLTLTESAYLAALPKAPTRYSPFGEHRDELENRKNFVLQKMKELNFISPEDYEKAKNEKTVFLTQKYQGIKAPHFVMYIRDELVKKYGEERVEKGGLKVITTLDWDLQEKAEKIISEYAKENEKKFNAKNAGLAAVDPKTGQILTMVGSRDYFDVKNDGNFNVTTAKRQPGSSFKPFVYASAFKKGYTPDTVLFDLETNFAVPGAEPYIPQNYDNKFRGPINLKNALAQSINVPAVKVLYLSGIDEALNTARAFGISTLTDRDRYGLSLVLGGGEVKLLEMTGAYAVFANNGIKNELNGILEIKEKEGNTLYKFQKKETEVIDKNIAKKITDILSDASARGPSFGEALSFPGKEVAAKTGTTNNYRDAWVLGYTPNIAIGVWAGNNDNTSMEKKVAGFIAAPMWHKFFEEALKKFPAENFKKPDYGNAPQKPVLRGEWRGGKVYENRLITEVHSILYWVDKDNPLGQEPQNPARDSQFQNWETPIRNWLKSQNIIENTETEILNQISDDKKPEYAPQIAILEPSANAVFKKSGMVALKIENQSHFALKQIDFFFKNYYLGSLQGTDDKIYQFTFNLYDFPELENTEKIKIKVYDTKGNTNTFEQIISITE